MNFIISSDHYGEGNLIENWFLFNDVPYELQSFWHPEFKRYHFDRNITDTTVILNKTLLHHIFREIQGLDVVTDFLSRNNRLFIYGVDHATTLCQFPELQEKMLDLDRRIRPGSIAILFDGPMTPSCPLTKLSHFAIYHMIGPLVANRPRFQSPWNKKNNPKYDYLITTVLKGGRPHRKILWNQLRQNPNLLAHGFTCFHEKPPTPDDRLGRINNLDPTDTLHPSMDLYLNCYMEVVPETFYQHFRVFTEKTWKPIVTKTPFLAIATSGYLSYLKDLGFKTFNSLIDESYDELDNIDDRVKKVIEVLEHIITNGTKEFYLASQTILDHNFAKLCELSGAWQTEFDNHMWQILMGQKDCASIS